MKRVQFEQGTLLLVNKPETSNKPVWVVLVNKETLLWIYDDSFDTHVKRPEEFLRKHYHANIAPLLKDLGECTLLTKGYNPTVSEYYRGVRPGIVSRHMSYWLSNKHAEAGHFTTTEMIAWSKDPGEVPQSFWSREFKPYPSTTANQAQELLELVHRN